MIDARHLHCGGSLRFQSTSTTLAQLAVQIPIRAAEWVWRVARPRDLEGAAGRAVLALVALALLVHP